MKRSLIFASISLILLSGFVRAEVVDGKQSKRIHIEFKVDRDQKGYRAKLAKHSSLRLPEFTLDDGASTTQKILPEIAREKLLRYEAKLLTPKTELEVK